MSNSIRHQERRRIRANQKMYEGRVRQNALRTKHREVITEPKEKK